MGVDFRTGTERKITGRTVIDWRSNNSNKYFLDGRDPNSYANIVWVFGQHDRGWKEREVIGKVRYMSAGGLERKAEPQQYVEKVGERIEGSEYRVYA